MTRAFASHFLKLRHHLEDTEGHRMELRFLRDTDAREFVVLRNRKLVFAREREWGVGLTIVSGTRRDTATIGRFMREILPHV